MKTGNRYKKVVVWILCLVLLMSIGTGCKKNSSNTAGNNNSNQTSTDNVARGRYVEKEIELPDGFDKSGVISAIWHDGKLEVFAFDKDYRCCKLVLSDGSWEQSECSWNNELGEKEGMFNKLVLGEDGYYYLMWITFGDGSNASTEIYRITDNGLEQLNLHFFDESTFISNFTVLKDGTVVYSDGYAIYIRSAEDKELFYDEGYESFCVSGDEILLKSSENQRIDVIDVNGNKIASYAVDFDISSCGIGAMEDDIYLFSSNGLYCHNRQGTIWQNLIDASMISIPNMMDNVIYAETREDFEDFYILAWDNTQSVHILSYIYDENMIATPTEEFTIYSLKDIPTIRQAISSYKSAHPEIGIHYVIAGDTTSLEDSIRSLNTELLSGNGADLLVLDGLQEQSYIEKGILLDMTELVEQYIESGDLMSNIMEEFRTDEKFYSVPVKVMVPLVYGDSEVIESMKSLDSLSDYLNLDSREDVFDIDKDYIAETFLKLYYDEIINPETNEIQKDALMKYAEIVEDLRLRYDQNHTKVVPYYTEIPDENNLSAGFGIYINQKEDRSTRVNQMNRGIMLSIPYYAETEANMECVDFMQTFVPSTVVGVNSASSHKETVIDFIRMLLSEEVQLVDTQDGFSVNQNYIEKDMVYDKFKDSILSMATDDAVMQYGALTSEQLQRFKELLPTLDHRYNYDIVILQMILNSMEGYLDKTMDLASFVNEVESQVSMYLAE